MIVVCGSHIYVIFHVRNSFLLFFLRKWCLVVTKTGSYCSLVSSLIRTELWHNSPAAFSSKGPDRSSHIQTGWKQIRLEFFRMDRQTWNPNNPAALHRFDLTAVLRKQYHHIFSHSEKCASFLRHSWYFFHLRSNIMQHFEFILCFFFLTTHLWCHTDHVCSISFSRKL